MIRNSLTRKLVVVFSGILLMVVVLNVIINGLLLSGVYRNIKIGAMEKLYNSIDELYCNGAETNEIIELVKNTLSTENLRVFIWDENNRLVIDSWPLSWTNGTENNNDRQIDFPERGGKEHFKFERFGRMETFMLYAEIEEDKILRQNQRYDVFSNVDYFSAPEEENYYLRGTCENGFKVLVQMPVASIEEAVALSNGLLIAVGIFMLVIGIIIVIITSKNIVKPIKKLSKIAQSMQNLNFSEKYAETRTDELGSLGKSINALSEKLEKTINELSENNLKLMEDIELKSKIDKQRKEFIANASHELKTPVALISGYAEGLRDNIAESEEARKIYTDVIIEETERIDHIIRQMLDLMEIDGVDQILRGEVLSVTGIADASINAFEVMLQNNKIKLDFIFDGECMAYGEYWRIYQAVSNYISNAINHVDENKYIKVTVSELEEKIRLGVFNTGLNIPEEEAGNIWERFYKVDKAHTREYGGSGLGLAIVKSIVELHDGEYGFINHSDGVEFYFTINKENSNET